ncbi:MAG: hypothetical protein QM692_04625 [Thermomicrobiales bacterium]
MPAIWIRSLLLLLALCVAAPVSMLETLPGPPASQAAPGETAAPSGGVHAARGAKARRHKARERRRAERRQARQDRREQRRKQRRSQPATVGGGIAADAARQANCEEAGLVYLPLSQTCTHGGDPLPPGVRATGRAAPVAASRAARLPAYECVGDGVSGARVQVLYVRPSNQASNFAAYQTSFRTWAAAANDTFAAAAAQTGGSRSLRFVTTPGCAIDVQEVTIAPGQNSDVDTLFAAIRAKGFTNTNRHYLAFVDSGMAGACGHGSLEDDDWAAQTNRHNYTPGIAAVYSNCWSEPSVAVHELLHTLGAVQLSAPNASGYFHCIDEYDVMCYSDGPGVTMRYDCPNASLDTTMIDCGKNDYFHTNPPAGNYLASHWNTANSRFLIGGGNGPDDDGADPVVNWVSPGGNDSITTVSSGVVTLTVNPTDTIGIRTVEFSRWNAAAQQWEDFLTLDEAPWTTTVTVDDLDMGINYFHVFAGDPTWKWTGASIRLFREDPNGPGPDDGGPTVAPPAVAPVFSQPVNGQKVKGGSALRLVVSSPSGVADLRYCLAATCPWEAGVPAPNPWRAPKKGVATFVARAGDGPVSDPVTVTIKKAKKKKKKKR